MSRCHCGQVSNDRSHRPKGSFFFHWQKKGEPREVGTRVTVGQCPSSSLLSALLAYTFLIVEEEVADAAPVKGQPRDKVCEIAYSLRDFDTVTFNLQQKCIYNK